MHPDDDLIVSHIALAVDNMAALRKRLSELGVQHRTNISVPNPVLGEGKIVQQVGGDESWMGDEKRG